MCRKQLGAPRACHLARDRVQHCSGWLLGTRMVLGLASEPADVFCQNSRSKSHAWKETPLANAVFWAARKGNLALLQLLLNSGRVDADCKDSVRLLHASTLHPHAFPINHLWLFCEPVISHRSAARSSTMELACITVTCGTTALMVASYSGHYDCSRELIMQGADINVQREVLLERTGSTALFFAAQQGHNDIVKLLLEFGASTDIQTKDGGTPLSAASQHGHAKVVETLLKNGANVHDQLSDGATPLFLAAQEGHVTIIRHLLTSGAKVNHPREDGTAPLWMAAQMGHSEVVKVLLLRGAERDADKKDGSTALFKAAYKGHNNVIEELLKFSPSLGLLKNGSTALHAAVMGGNVRSVVLLLGANADPNVTNKNNEQPGDLTQNDRILRLLRKQTANGSS
ncbi:hypothetical protein JZ751_008229 [Albula glossodonta]|uniref:Ankyrin repeat domain-containing protein 29 n=1 Tax=Albula glossodonta TaxID=121402 RepID=A0A8T2N2I9_9TELE|nr:hypothetical protein JZ751_008229 [Albula glossodonta]